MSIGLDEHQNELEGKDSAALSRSRYFARVDDFFSNILGHNDRSTDIDPGSRETRSRSGDMRVIDYLRLDHSASILSQLRDNAHDIQFRGGEIVPRPIDQTHENVNRYVRAGSPDTSTTPNEKLIVLELGVQSQVYLQWTTMGVERVLALEESG